jgi:hypothetical protein
MTTMAVYFLSVLIGPFLFGDKPRTVGVVLEQARFFSSDSPFHDLDCQPNRDECNRYGPK